MENISEEKLQELGIFEIRNIAREVGVYSPTLLKKQVLIEKIMRVVTGKDEPYIKTTKQGRPPKNFSNINNLVDVFVPSHIFEEKKDKTTFAVFNDINENINIETYGTNEKNFSGLIKVYETYSLLFINNIFKEDKSNVVFINNNQTNFYKLKNGDYISCKAIIVDESKPALLKEIYSINNKPFDSNKERDEDYLSKIALAPNKKLKTSIYNNDEEIYSKIDLFFPLAKGQRILFNTSQTNFCYQIIHRLTTSTNNLKGLAILIDETPENYFEISSNTMLDVVSNNYKKNDNLMLEIETKINNLKRKVEQGDDVLLFINDKNKFLNYFANQNILNKVSKEEAHVLAEQELNNIILLGKNTECGSLTFVTIDALQNQNNLFNNVISFEKKNYEIRINFDNSQIMGIEKILTKSELEKLKNIK